MQDTHDDADEHRHEDDRRASRAEPDDDERPERDLGQCIQDDDIGFEDFAQEIAPPERERDPAAEHDGDDKAHERLRERDADVVEEGAVAVERGDRIADARGRTREERIGPAEAGHELPDAEKQGKEPDPQRPDEDRALPPPFEKGHMLI